MGTLIQRMRGGLRKALPNKARDYYYRWRYRRLHEARLISKYADPSRSAIDVGANRGAVTAILAERCPRVYAYEPNLRALKSLRSSAPPNVTIYPYGVSDQTGTFELVEPIWGGEVSHAHSSLVRGFDGFDVKRTEIETIRLDDMGHNAHDIGFIKIDVEGHELAAVRGGVELLTTAKPTLWIEMDGYEYKGGIATGIEAIESLGYQGYFHVGTTRYRASLFSEKVFQPRLEQTGGHLPGYISNFLFLPK